MTYVPGSELGDAVSSGRAGTAATTDGRVAGAILASQTFLVVRILSVLVCVSLLPAHLPSVALRLDSAHTFVLPLAGFDPGAVLLLVAAVSALELYLVYRLADRVRLARFGVLLIESCAIVATTTALAFGASLAILPLVASVGATCLLLLNRVRWAFLLQPRVSNLTGHRQGGTFAGYAAPSLDSPKPAQTVGYQARRRETYPAESSSVTRPSAVSPLPPAAWRERPSTRPYSRDLEGAPVSPWSEFRVYGTEDGNTPAPPPSPPPGPIQTGV